MNEKQKKWKLILAGLMAGLLIGGTVAVTTPSVAAGPAKVWKQIKKKADKRYYTKKKADKRYAKEPTLIRGAYALSIQAGAGGTYGVSSISYGVTLPGNPIAHYIRNGDPVPLGCAGGTALLPTASPGHLCVFEGYQTNAGDRGLTSTRYAGSDVAERYGSVVYASSAGAGAVRITGSWAVGTDSDAVWKTVAPSNKRPGGK